MSHPKTGHEGTWINGELQFSDLLMIAGRLAIIRGKPVSIVVTKIAYERFVNEWIEARKANGVTGYDLHIPTLPDNIYGARLCIEQDLDDALETAKELTEKGHRVMIVAA